MAIEEEKIINGIENESEGIRGYRTFVKSNAEFRYKRQQQKLIFATLLLIIYILFGLGLLFVFRKNTSFLVWPFPTSDSERFIELQDHIDIIEVEISKLKTNNSTSIAGISNSLLETRMSVLEDSINIDPGKAVTAILIREQQKGLEMNFRELKDAQIRLENKVDNFITSVVLVPVVGFVLAIAGWFIQSRFFKKKDDR